MKMKKDIEIFKNIQSIGKDNIFPNLFISGCSISQIESLAFRLVEWIESEKRIYFKGIVKHFCIEMPYFDDNKGALNFNKSLQESVNIAKDCYDEFCGIILIECSDGWEKYGVNSAMSMVMEYMRSLKKVHFIVLVPWEQEKTEYLLSVFSTIGLWFSIEYGCLEVEQCVKICVDMAQKRGYTISDRVQQALKDRLIKRKHMVTDNETAVIQWIEQIIMNREIMNDENKEIVIEDINCISGFHNKNKTRAIGFGADRGDE